MKRGTKLFVAGSTFECSSFIPDDHPGFGTTAAELRKCARQNDAQGAPDVTVDGRSVMLTAVESRLPGTHTIVIEIDADTTITTTIIVK